MLANRVVLKIGRLANVGRIDNGLKRLGLFRTGFSDQIENFILNSENFYT